MKNLLFALVLFVTMNVEGTSLLAQSVDEIRAQALRGNQGAMVNLGVCYQTGDGVPKNPEAAAWWYRQAMTIQDVEKNDAVAEYNLSQLYSVGEGVPKDLAETVSLLRKSAERGYSPSQVGLGNCYENGDGIAKDMTEAAKWYLRAANNKDAAGAFNAARCYQSGNGVPQDLVEAYKWYNVAAAKGMQESVAQRDGVEKLLNAEQLERAQKLSSNFMLDK